MRRLIFAVVDADNASIPVMRCRDLVIGVRPAPPAA
jgi:hypothetical protein